VAFDDEAEPDRLFDHGRSEAFSGDVEELESGESPASSVAFRGESEISLFGDGRDRNREPVDPLLIEDRLLVMFDEPSADGDELFEKRLEGGDVPSE